MKPASNWGPLQPKLLAEYQLYRKTLYDDQDHNHNHTLMQRFVDNIFH